MAMRVPHSHGWIHLKWLPATYQTNQTGQGDYPSDTHCSSNYGPKHRLARHSSTSKVEYDDALLDMGATCRL